MGASSNTLVQRSQTLLRCVCVTGLRRFGIQDPSPPKALFTRVLKVPTYALRHLLLPPNPPASAVKAVPKHQTYFLLFPKRLLPGSYLVWHRSYWSTNEGPPPQTPAYPF